jgi:hypothetical protein
LTAQVSTAYTVPTPFPFFHKSSLTPLTVETYHTGAGLADPVFTSDLNARAASFLNGTHLQFDTGFTPFAANPYLGDTNYARWEPATINSGYGSSNWEITEDGLTILDEEFGGWLVCEWFHGTNAPQLFTLIEGFDSPEGVYPATCAKVLLRPEYF